MSEWPGNGTQMPTPGTDPNDPNRKPPVPAFRSASVRQEEIERGVGTYTARLAPDRGTLVNYAQTVALGEDVEVVLITMVKK